MSLVLEQGCVESLTLKFIHLLLTHTISPQAKKGEKSLLGSQRSVGHQDQLEGERTFTPLSS